MMTFCVDCITRYESEQPDVALEDRLEGITNLVEHPIRMKPPGEQVGNQI